MPILGSGIGRKGHSTGVPFVVPVTENRLKGFGFDAS